MDNKMINDKIVEIRNEDHKISLSMRALVEDSEPAEEAAEAPVEEKPKKKAAPKKKAE